MSVRLSASILVTTGTGVRRAWTSRAESSLLPAACKEHHHGSRCRPPEAILDQSKVTQCSQPRFGGPLINHPKEVISHGWSQIEHRSTPRFAVTKAWPSNCRPRRHHADGPGSGRTIHACMCNTCASVSQCDDILPLHLHHYHIARPCILLPSAPIINALHLASFNKKVLRHNNFELYLMLPDHCRTTSPSW